jgi:hypothetical protein
VHKQAEKPGHQDLELRATTHLLVVLG